MKSVLKISILRQDLPSPAIWTDLLKIYPGDDPSAVVNGVFQIRSQMGASHAEAILKKLTDFGMTPWTDKSRSRLRNEYKLDVKVEWEQTDFDEAKYLSWIPKAYLGECMTDESGTVTVDTDELDDLDPSQERDLLAGKLHLSFTDSPFIVSDAFRREINNTGLVGFEYGPAIQFVGANASTISSKYWILSSNKTLPPISQNPKSVHLPPEVVCYEAEALRALGEFDHALMGDADSKEPAYVMSQRFYQLCCNQRIPLHLTPVEVIP